MKICAELNEKRKRKNKKNIWSASHLFILCHWFCNLCKERTNTYLFKKYYKKCSNILVLSVILHEKGKTLFLFFGFFFFFCVWKPVCTLRLFHFRYGKPLLQFAWEFRVLLLLLHLVRSKGICIMYASFIHTYLLSRTPPFHIFCSLLSFSVSVAF